MKDAKVLEALNRLRIGSPEALLRQYGAARCVDVGRAYRIAREDGHAKSPGWVVMALREDKDVSSWLETWKERQQAKRQRLYLVKQGQKAEAMVIDFDKRYPDRRRYSAEERMRPLREYMQQWKGRDLGHGDLAERLNTCQTCSRDPCRCPAEDVWQRAHDRAAKLKPLIEDEEKRRRTEETSAQRKALFDDALSDLLPPAA